LVESIPREKQFILENSMNNNLIAIIEQEIANDDCNRSRQSAILIEAVEASTDRESIDRVLIALCGWSFETLLNRTK